MYTDEVALQPQELILIPRSKSQVRKKLVKNINLLRKLSV